MDFSTNGIEISPNRCRPQNTSNPICWCCFSNRFATVSGLPTWPVLVTVGLEVSVALALTVIYDKLKIENPINGPKSESSQSKEKFD